MSYLLPMLHRLYSLLPLAVLFAGPSVLWLSIPAISFAGSSETVVRVEEDWKVVLIEPDGHVDSPQFHTIMSPFGYLDSCYVQVTWNYRELPNFLSGGVQIQAWNGDNLLFHGNMRTGKLSTVSETITWTQVLEPTGSDLYFSLTNGKSTTWGTFRVKAKLMASVPNLNYYSSTRSAQSSFVTFGSNRVKFLGITEVRRYGPSGLISIDTKPKVIFQLEGN